MPPKRKSPAAAPDSRVDKVPPVKKTTKGKAADQASSSTVALSAKQYKYSDPSLVANEGPAPVILFKWPSSEDDDEDDEDDEEEEDAAPGSLRGVLNEIANERAEAVHEALNPKDGPGSIQVGEARRRIAEAEKPFVKKMDEARDKFVKEGKMTAEEVKAIVGLDDETRKQKRRAKKTLQQVLNKLEKQMAEAIQQAINLKEDDMNVEEKYRITVEKSKPFEEKMEKIREFFQKDGTLTEDEIKAIVPTVKDEDENQKKDKGKELAPPRVVTDEGFPVTKAGFAKFVDINEELDKRNPDLHGMYIFNDYAGYGTIEILENTLAEFNTIIFQKDVSPLLKWAIVEGLTLYLAVDDHIALMMNEDGERITEIFDMMGVMYITALEMLHESTLIGPTSPLPDNIGLMTLFFIDFARNTATDYELEWVHEIVRAADKYGVTLNPLEQVKGVDEDTLEELRDMCEEDRKMKGLAWKSRWTQFKKDHPGGDEYDITKMPEKEKAKYTFGTAENDARINGDDWEDSEFSSDESGLHYAFGTDDSDSDSDVASGPGSE